jgi:hypothetical protein
MPAAMPRRARWVLGGAAAVFAVALVAAIRTVPSLVPASRSADAGPDTTRVSIDITRADEIEPQVSAARQRVEPALTEQFDGALGSIRPAGWTLEALPSRPRLECWREADVTGCDLSTHTGGEAAVPTAGAPRLDAMNRLLGATDAALARDGWRCDRSLAGRRPVEPHVWQATCRAGRASLEVKFWPRPKAQVGKPRQPGEPGRLSLDVEARTIVYSSAPPGRTT